MEMFLAKKLTRKSYGYLLLVCMSCLPDTQMSWMVSKPEMNMYVKCLSVDSLSSFNLTEHPRTHLDNDGVILLLITVHFSFGEQTI